MERVVTINLNGNAYQLEQGAYDALSAYLGAAEAGLRDNPDRAEILSDLEQAIADKCVVTLGARKTVVNSAEMTALLKEMGPVTDSASAGAQDSTSEASKTAPTDGADKRLYRLREGALFAGVCSDGVARDIAIDTQTWNRRHREYMDKIRTGSLFEVAEVLRDLSLLKFDKDLSFGERKMLDTARGLLVKELAFACATDEAQIRHELEQIFTC